MLESTHLTMIRMERLQTLATGSLSGVAMSIAQHAEGLLGVSPLQFSVSEYASSKVKKNLDPGSAILP